MNGSIKTAADLGRDLQERRKRLGLTLAEVAELADVSVSFVHQLEHGKSTVRLSKVIDVANVLGLRIELVDRLKGRR